MQNEQEVSAVTEKKQTYAEVVAFDSAMSCLKIRKADLHSSVKVDA